MSSRRHRFAACAFAISLAFASPSFAEEAPLASLAQAKLLGPNPSYVGQMVQLELSLLRDSALIDPPAPFFPELKMEGAIVVRAEGAPPPTLQEVEGKSYMVQTRKYLIFPQNDGDLEVPALNIVIPLDPQPQVVQSEALQLHADFPRVREAKLPLVASDVHLTRQVQGSLQGLLVGESFALLTRIEAKNTDPIMLPRLQEVQVDGLAAYPETAQNTAHSERGAFIAAREQRTNFVAKEWGFFEIPSESLYYLDPDAGIYGHQIVESERIFIAPNPQLGLGCMGSPLLLGKSALALLLAGAGLLLGVRRVLRFRSELQKRRYFSGSPEERAAFAALAQTAKEQDACALLSKLYAWMSAAQLGVITLEGLSRCLQEAAAGSPPPAAARADSGVEDESTALLGRLQTAAAQRGVFEEGAALIKMLRRFRRKHRAPTARLAPLNAR